jgi:type II secretory pathway component PulL
MDSICKYVTNPDWWIVLFTAISTIAVIVIAIVQIRMQRHQTQLQKRQTEAQEYHTYRQLYILISSANR